MANSLRPWDVPGYLKITLTLCTGNQTEAIINSFPGVHFCTVRILALFLVDCIQKHFQCGTASLNLSNKKISKSSLKINILSVNEGCPLGIHSFKHKTEDPFHAEMLKSVV